MGRRAGAHYGNRGGGRRAGRRRLDRAAGARRKRELARITAALKREIARADHEGMRLSELLADGARRRIEAFRRSGVRTVVLDECHHLASLWGYVVREAIEELGDVHLVRLTPTPPAPLTPE